MTLLVGSIFHMTRKIVSEMTYNVSMGTLNPTIPYRWFVSLSLCLWTRLLKNLLTDETWWIDRDESTIIWDWYKSGSELFEWGVLNLTFRLLILKQYRELLVLFGIYATKLELCVVLPHWAMNLNATYSDLLIAWPWPLNFTFCKSST